MIDHPEELRRYEGSYAFEGKTFEVRTVNGRLEVPGETFGIELEAVHLVPVAPGEFSRGLYRDGALERIFWPGERIRLSRSRDESGRAERVQQEPRP